jgi:microcystin-dependent protein
MSQPFIGEIKIVPYNFAPRGWAFCAGQILSIAQNTALFALLGTTYGGNGQTTFALPDLRGRRAYHEGQGPGLSAFDLGEIGGTETVTLLQTELPQHSHTVRAARGATTQPSTSPSSAAWSNEVLGSPQNLPYSDAAADTAMASSSVTSSGGGQPHENRPPYLVLNYCIALEGVFPSRN